MKLRDRLAIFFQSHRGTNGRQEALIHHAFGIHQMTLFQDSVATPGNDKLEASLSVAVVSIVGVRAHIVHLERTAVIEQGLAIDLMLRKPIKQMFKAFGKHLIMGEKGLVIGKSFLQVSNSIHLQTAIFRALVDVVGEKEGISQSW